MGVMEQIKSTWVELVGMNIRQLLMQGVNLGELAVVMANHVTSSQSRASPSMQDKENTKQRDYHLQA